MNTEEEFLKNYDSSQYEKLSMTADILVLSVSSKETLNYRKTDEKKMSILLMKRKDFPFKDKWCLPGGFLNPKEETLEECARRILKKEVNLSHYYLEQLYTFDDINRDPRMRVVSTSFVALVDRNNLEEIVENSSWFDIILLEDQKSEVKLVLDNGFEKLTLHLRKGEYPSQYTSFNPVLAFDHDKVLTYGLERIRNKVNYTDIVFHLMPLEFTLKELQQVYEVILNKKLLDPAFRRIISNKVCKTERMKTGEGHRPSSLYRYQNGD